MLEQSEKDFPDDYNPPARLASAYRAMKQYDDAAAASDRALAKAYGPRKIGILQTRADIETGRGDAAASRRASRRRSRIAEALPEGQRSERTIAALKKKLGVLLAAASLREHRGVDSRDHPQRVLVVELLQDVVRQVEAVHLPERVALAVVVEVLVGGLEHAEVDGVLRRAPRCPSRTSRGPGT